MDVLKVLGSETLPFRSRKPRWFKVPPPGGEKYRELQRMIADEGLHTVCQEAACPPFLSNPLPRTSRAAGC